MEETVVADLHTIGSQLKRGWIVTRDTAEPLCTRVLREAESSAAEALLSWMDDLFPLLVETISSLNPELGRAKARQQAVNGMTQSYASSHRALGRVGQNERAWGNVQVPQRSTWSNRFIPASTSTTVRPLCLSIHCCN